MLLLERHLVAGAHHRVLVPACPDPEAPLRGVGEAAAVAGIRELGFHRAARVGGVHPQVRVQRIGVHHLARIHLEVRIPDRLELPERPNQLGAEHLGQQLRAGVAITVLAG